jgi:hypothetical protein
MQRFVDRFQAHLGRFSDTIERFNARRVLERVGAISLSAGLLLAYVPIILSLICSILCA